MYIRRQSFSIFHALSPTSRLAVVGYQFSLWTGLGGGTLLGGWRGADQIAAVIRTGIPGRMPPFELPESPDLVE
jgi:hypothetical protein